MPCACPCALCLPCSFDMSYARQHLEETIQIVQQLDAEALERMVTLLADLRARDLLNRARRGRDSFIASDAPEKCQALALRLLRIKVKKVEVKRF